MEFAQNLRKIMNEKGISNYRLAKMLDVHPTTIKNWLESKTEPKFEMIDKIAKALDVPIEELLCVNTLEKTMQLMVERLPQKKLLSAFDKLNERGKEIAIERVEELTEIEKYTTSDSSTEKKK